MKTPIADFIETYAKSKTARCHMPGHKGKGGLYSDITEVKGADELYAAEGIIKESEDNASLLFESAHSYYSTEGSTLAIKAMLTLASSERPRGERPLFVAARNAHKAFLYGAAMLDAEVEWVYSDSRHICRCSLTPEDIGKAVASCKRKPDGVYITSPDYLGNMLDVGGIAQVCDKLGVKLLVDNAHGAYLAFLDKSLHPMALGASMCADSAHKTLPVLTGGAYLHIAKKAEGLCCLARNALALYASTSPSYLILRSLDECNRYIEENRGERRVIDFVKQMKKDLLEKGIVTEGNEPLKITINAPASGYLGEELASILRNGGIEPEFCDRDRAVLMLSEMNSDSDLLLVKKVLDAISAKAPIVETEICVPRCERAMSVREAVFAPFELVRAEEAEGRICAAPTVSCPPAVPIAVSGERINAECVKAFLHYGIEQIAVVIE